MHDARPRELTPHRPPADAEHEGREQQEGGHLEPAQAVPRRAGGGGLVADQVHAHVLGGQATQDLVEQGRRRLGRHGPERPGHRLARTVHPGAPPGQLAAPPLHGGEGRGVPGRVEGVHGREVGQLECAAGVHVLAHVRAECRAGRRGRRGRPGGVLREVAAGRHDLPHAVTQEGAGLVGRQTQPIGDLPVGAAAQPRQSHGLVGVRGHAVDEVLGQRRGPGRAGTTPTFRRGAAGAAQRGHHAVGEDLEPREHLAFAVGRVVLLAQVEAGLGGLLPCRQVGADRGRGGVVAGAEHRFGQAVHPRDRGVVERGERGPVTLGAAAQEGVQGGLAGVIGAVGVGLGRVRSLHGGLSLGNRGGQRTRRSRAGARPRTRRWRRRSPGSGTDGPAAWAGRRSR